MVQGDVKMISGQKLQSLVGKYVKLGRGGPDQRDGVLLGVKDDYLSLQTADGGLLHYPLQHLKSITEQLGVANADSASTQGTSLQPLPGTFAQLLRSYLGHKVRVYDHGPEMAAGFLFAVENDMIQVVPNADEKVYYAVFHIRCLSVPTPEAKGEDAGGGKGKKSTGGRHSKDGGRHSKGGGRRSTGGGHHSTDGGRRSTDGGRRSTGGGRRSTGGHRSTSGGRHSTDGGRRSTDGGRHSTDGGHHSTDGGRRSTHGGRRTTHGGRHTTRGGPHTRDGGRRTTTGHRTTGSHGDKPEKSGGGAA